MSALSIGDRVKLPQGQKAVLRWTGRIAGRGDVEYAGVELIGRDARQFGKHSGEFNGHKYFETGIPGTGLFLSYTQLVSANLRTPRSRTSLADRNEPAEASFHRASPAPASPRGSLRVLTTSTTNILPPPSASPKSPKRPAGIYVPAGTTTNLMSPSPRHSTTDLSNLSRLDSRADLSGTAVAVGGPVDADKLLRSEARVRKLKQMLADSRKEFQESLKMLHAHTDGLAEAFNVKVREIQEEADRRVIAAESNKSISAGSDSALIEEQRIALAAMQNKLLDESQNQQERLSRALAENASLKRELALARKDDEDAGKQLENLLKDLEAQETRLASMQAAVAEAEDLKAEVAHLRQRNAELEVQVASPNTSVVGPRTPHNPNRLSFHTRPRVDPSHGEASLARLEREIEAKLLAESSADDVLEGELASLRVESADSSTSTISEMLKIKPKDASSPEPATKPKFDLAAGRDDWCALCERQGHTAVECPY